jgi:hypothetical protein
MTGHAFPCVDRPVQDRGMSNPRSDDGRLAVVPVTFRTACEFVAEHHRHNKPPAATA